MDYSYCYSCYKSFFDKDKILVCGVWRQPCALVFNCTCHEEKFQEPAKNYFEDRNE